MGVNLNEKNTGSAEAFEAALKFHDKAQIKPISTGFSSPPNNVDSEEWDKYNIYINGEKSPTQERSSKIKYYLEIAEAIAKRGTCLRRKFGAIIVKNDAIISTGYVGAPRGRENCCDRKICFRQEMGIAPGQRYELCRSVHAEMNAIINTSRDQMIGATMYLVGIENDGSYTDADCCAMCKRVIINSGINQVIAKTKLSYRTFNVEDWVKNDDSLSIHEGY